MALRKKSAVAGLAPLALAAVFFALGSSQIGYQDLAAPIAQRPAAPDRAREHIVASARSTVNAATFNLPRPIGTTIVEPPAYGLVRFDSTASDTTGSIAETARPSRHPVAAEERVFTINRAAKGDRLVAQPLELSTETPAATERPIPQRKSEAGRETDELQVAMRSEPPLEANPQAAADPATDVASDESAPSDEGDTQIAFGTMRLHFDPTPLGATLASIEPWAAGEAPILTVPTIANLEMPGAPTDVIPPRKAEPKSVSLRDAVTVAGKGEVTGEGKRPMSPAERLGLTGKASAKAERCLANAVYFESRSEPVRGQIGVAQVVLNRVFSEYYPGDVCGVVYQNAHRHLSCQFTFACDGIPDVVTELEQWERAKRIARDSLDGKLWLKEIGKATHYHASYVYPYWVRSMRRLTKIGLHSFYRPRKWGDGSDEPSWGNPAATTLALANL